MIEKQQERNIASVCNLVYLKESFGNKNNLIREIMDEFLTQVPQELKALNEAVKKVEYTRIKSVAHTMKTSVSILGISSLAPILQEMQDLGALATNIEKISELNQELNRICALAIGEIEIEKHNYN